MIAPSTADTLSRAENDARLLQFEIGHAAALLALLARAAGEPGSNFTRRTRERHWLQAEYLAERIAQHVRDLSDALDKVERVAGRLSQGRDGGPGLSVVAGGAQ
jgi:hypothetical protein